MGGFFDSHFSVVLNNNFVSNNTIGKDVWFDNVNIQHQRGYVVEENHYYPFGLTLACTAAGTTPQPYKFQGEEL